MPDPIFTEYRRELVGVHPKFVRPLGCHPHENEDQIPAFAGMTTDESGMHPLVAKTLFDLLKIAVAAAFASMVLLARNLRHLAAKFPEALV